MEIPDGQDRRTCPQEAVRNGLYGLETDRQDTASLHMVRSFLVSLHHRRQDRSGGPAAEDGVPCLADDETFPGHGPLHAGRHLLVITHEHWDHLDYATLRELRPKVRHAVCPTGIAEYLVLWGYNPEIITEMGWYEETQMTNDESQMSNVKSPINITCLPTRHFSNRLFGANETLWASFMLEAEGRKVYIGGDGGYDDRFRRIHERFGEVDLAIMENGQYNPNWAYIHMLPQDLEQAMTDLQAKQYITVHHDKFSLAPHAWNEPDSVAHSIAEKDHLQLLDHKIGTLIEW